jgi:hypothetical protein
MTSITARQPKIRCEALSTSCSVLALVACAPMYAVNLLSGDARSIAKLSKQWTDVAVRKEKA